MLLYILKFTEGNPYRIVGNVHSLAIVSERRRRQANEPGESAQQRIFTQKFNRLMNDMVQLLDLAEDPKNVPTGLENYDKVKKIIAFQLKYSDMMGGSGSLPDPFVNQGIIEVELGLKDTVVDLGLKDGIQPEPWVTFSE